MLKPTYYEVLEIKRDATPEEIASAKNRLAKKYHPDVNMKFGIDTTDKMQEVLEAYRVLSDASKRAEYDETLTGSSSGKLQMFDLKKDAKTDKSQSTEDTSCFLYYWKTATRLQDILNVADRYYHTGRKNPKLYVLAVEAAACEQILSDGGIPEDVWTPDAMNWLVLRWYQNRNYTTEYLIQLYYEHVKTEVTFADKRKDKKKVKTLQKRLKKLSAY